MSDFIPLSLGIEALKKPETVGGASFTMPKGKENDKKEVFRDGPLEVVAPLAALKRKQQSGSGFYKAADATAVGKDNASTLSISPLSLGPSLDEEPQLVAANAPAKSPSKRLATTQASDSGDDGLGSESGSADNVEFVDDEAQNSNLTSILRGITEHNITLLANLKKYGAPEALIKVFEEHSKLVNEVFQACLLQEQETSFLRKALEDIQSAMEELKQQGQLMRDDLMQKLDHCLGNKLVVKTVSDLATVIAQLPHHIQWYFEEAFENAFSVPYETALDKHDPLIQPPTFSSNSEPTPTWKSKPDVSPDAKPEPKHRTSGSAYPLDSV